MAAYFAWVWPARNADGGMRAVLDIYGAAITAVGVPVLTEEDWRGYYDALVSRGDLRTEDPVYEPNPDILAVIAPFRRWKASAFAGSSVPDFYLGTSGRLAAPGNAPSKTTLAFPAGTRDVMRFEAANSQALRSVESVALWSFLHNGAGCYVVWWGQFRALPTAANMTFCATVEPAALTPGFRSGKASGSGNQTLLVKGDGGATAGSINAVGAIAQNAPFRSVVYYQEGHDPELFNAVDAVSSQTNSIGAPSAGAASFPFTIAWDSAATYADIDVAEMVVFNKLPSAQELAVLEYYAEKEYGL